MLDGHKELGDVEVIDCHGDQAEEAMAPLWGCTTRGGGTWHSGQEGGGGEEADRARSGGRLARAGRMRGESGNIVTTCRCRGVGELETVR